MYDTFDRPTATTVTGVTLMGVRLYSPIIGRFLSTDPVYGGNANTYSYPADPIGGYDLSGKMSVFFNTVGIGIFQKLVSVSIFLSRKEVRVLLRGMETSLTVSGGVTAVWQQFTRVLAKKGAGLALAFAPELALALAAEGALLWAVAKYAVHQRRGMEFYIFCAIPGQISVNFWAT